MPTYREARATIRALLAAECGCDSEAFLRPDLQFCARPARPPSLARRYARQEPLFDLIASGAGAIVCGSEVLLPALRGIFAGCDRDAAFEPVCLAAVAALLAPHGLTVTAPLLRLVCGDDTWIACSAPSGLTVALEPAPSESRLAALGAERWPHAYTLPARRPNVWLAVARHGGTAIGVATMSEDSASLWQIGIDVALEFRGRGVGAALTSALAREALRSGRIPFYGVAPSNLPSVATALTAGFRPTWIEAYSVPLTAAPAP